MNILITGTNKGIGLELARIYAEQGHTVYATCRKRSAALAALPHTKILEKFDVTKTESLQSLNNFVGHTSINILINNAGIYLDDSLEKFSNEDLLKQFEVNTLGMLNVTKTLLPNLKTNSKIGIITSRMGSVADNTSGGYYGYRMSKAAANMMGKSLAVDLKDEGIAVALLHPGYVRTEMTGGQGMIDPDQSATGLVKIMEKLNIKNTGKFWHTNGEELPW